jgi:hypothetical protein
LFLVVRQIGQEVRLLTFAAIYVATSAVAPSLL